LKTICQIKLKEIHRVEHGDPARQLEQYKKEARDEIVRMTQGESGKLSTVIHTDRAEVVMAANITTDDVTTDIPQVSQILYIF
jgi:hypothetical protein